MSHGLNDTRVSPAQQQHDAEKVRQQRSRLIEILNVPQRVRLGFDFCGLAGRDF
jgi:hypothetical protein